MKNFWYRHGEAIVLTGAGLALIGIIALIIIGATVESRQWADFEKTHECKVTGRMSGDLVTGITSSGSFVSGVTPDKTAYTCNDGVTYWR